MKFLRFLVALVALAMPAVSHAVIVNFSVSGQVTSVGVGLTPYFSVGDAATINHGWNSILVTDPHPVFPGVSEVMNGQLGDWSIGSYGNLVVGNWMELGHNTPDNQDYIRFESNAGGTIGDFYVRFLRMSLIDSTGTVLNGSALPTSINLGDFTSGGFVLVLEHRLTGVQSEIHGDFNLDQPVVPEPATLGLLAMGIAGITAGRRRMRAAH